MFTVRYTVVTIGSAPCYGPSGSPSSSTGQDGGGGGCRGVLKRRKFSPGIPEVISKPLKDKKRFSPRTRRAGVAHEGRVLRECPECGERQRRPILVRGGAGPGWPHAAAGLARAMRGKQNQARTEPTGRNSISNARPRYQVLEQGERTAEARHTRLKAESEP